MSETDPLIIVDRLLVRGVRLVVIGGHAVNFYGYIRATEDVDIVFERTNETEQILFEELSKIDAYWITNDIDPQTGIESPSPVTLKYIQRTNMMMLGTNYGWVDLFDFIPGLPDEPVSELLDLAIESKGRPYASLQWLRRMKQAAGRPQDLVDLENLPLGETKPDDDE